MTQPRVTDLVRSLLDRGYAEAARNVGRAFAAATNSGIVAQRLNELDAEAARLHQLGQRLQPDNPVLRALLADLETTLRGNVSRISDGASMARESAVAHVGRLTRELALPGVSNQQLATIGVRWNYADPEAVNALVDYVNSPAWAREMATLPERVNELIRQKATLGIVNGWNPRTTAQEIRLLTQDVPAQWARTLIRTVQLTSYRDAAVLHRLANADILTEQIRIATLDARTCMACVALHGTRLPIDARIDDHHNGRCTSISVVRGRPREVESGEAWFRRRSEDEQREQMGDGAWRAWRAGKLQLSDLVHHYDDRIFGEMVRAASLKGVLGDAAADYIRRGREKE